MRQYLVTKFVCATCGNNLEISSKPFTGLARYAEGEPSGAYKHESVIQLEPCENCMRPLEDMRRAARTLLEGGAA
jgi:hypothetical protein